MNLTDLKIKLDNFYKYASSFGLYNFTTINPIRKKYIDELAAKYRDTYSRQFMPLVEIIGLTINASYRNKNCNILNNGDEILYFFINVVDPNLEYLLKYELANKKEEITNYYGLFDLNLIRFERALNIRFNIFDPDIGFYR